MPETDVHNPDWMVIHWTTRLTIEADGEITACDPQEWRGSRVFVKDWSKSGWLTVDFWNQAHDLSATMNGQRCVCDTMYGEWAIRKVYGGRRVIDTPEARTLLAALKDAGLLPAHVTDN